jgi:glycosyltransferase involved in cell wall biosynthesis
VAEELISPAGLASGRLDVDKCASRLPRICYLANAASSHTAKWVNHFCARGHEVHVISFEDPRGITDRAFIHKLRARTSSNLRYFTASGQVKRIIDEIQPSLLNAHYAAGYGTLGRLARFHPYILSVWGSDVFDVPLKSPLHRLLIKKNLASADEIGSTSQFMAKHTRRYCDRPITVTPFGVDCNVFAPSNHQVHEPKEFVIGTVKSLEEKYGIEYLIRCFALLVSKYKGARKLRLVIAGDGSLRGKLSRLARECGVDELTEFLGAVPHDRVPEVLNRFSVFVALSILDSESFGVAVVEASACGLPVVISDVPGMGEVVRDGITGLVVRRRDAAAAAEAISTVIENGKVCKEMGMAGRNFVMKNYEWSENAGRMERLYRLVLKRSGATTHSRGELTRLNC